MLEMTTSYIVSRCIQVMAELGVADRIGPRPRNVEDLARECDAHADTLRRVLRLLASRGVFREEEPGMFAHTPLSEALRRDHPASMRAWAQMTGGPIWAAFSGLLHSLRSGNPAFQTVHGVPLYDYLKTHPKDRIAFAEAMGDWGRQLADSVLSVRDFSDAELVVDVGGGHGFLLAEILRRYPEARGTLIDLPEVADHAAERMQTLGLAQRCTVLGGNFFESVPAGGSVYVLSWILHNWDDDAALEILRTCRRAMGTTGRLLTIDHVLRPGNDYDFGRTSDLAMLVAFGGRERTESEFRQLFQRAGFNLLQTTSLAVPVSLLESVPT